MDGDHGTTPRKWRGLPESLLMVPVMCAALIGFFIGLLTALGHVLWSWLLSPPSKKKGAGLLSPFVRSYGKTPSQPINVSGDVSIDSRIIRVFIASTFEDMRIERDLLIRNVFPRLNQHFRHLGISIIPVDLRWGLTQTDIEEQGLVRLCVSRIDQCRPYFLGLIGNRYGYLLEDIGESEITDYPWLEGWVGRSILDLEIFHGVLNNPESPKRVFLYSPEDLLQEAPNGDPGTLADQPAILALKTDIESAGFDIYGYVEVSELIDDIYETFSSTLEEDLKHVDLQPSETDLDGMLQWYHHSGHLCSYVHEPEVFACIERYLDAGGKPLLIVGEHGAGKSSLIAGYAMQWRNSRQPRNESLIISLGHSESPAETLREIMGQLNNIVAGLPEPPLSDTEVIDQFPAWLIHVTRYTLVVLIIDNIHALLPGSTGEPLFPWLPETLPATVRLMAACEPGRAAMQLTQAGWQRFDLHPMTAKAARIVVKHYFEHYCKRLEQTHIEALAIASEGQLPLYLILLLNEIRVFGLFDQMDEFIRSLVHVPDLKSLYHRLFDRLEHDNELYRDEWRWGDPNDEPWWIYAVLGYIAEAPTPVTEEEERALVRQLLQNSTIENQDYLMWFSALAQDLGIVEYRHDGLVIASPLLRNVLRKRRLYLMAADRFQSLFASLPETADRA